MTDAERGTSEQRENRRAAHRWVLGVLGLLGLTIAAQGVLLAFALSDPSSVAEPDYYAKAVAWDAHRAQEAHNAELGWRIQLETEAAGADRLLRVALADVAGQPVRDATVKLEAFHKARRADVVRATLPAREAGYGATLPLRRPGLWELRFTVTRGADTYTETLERMLGGGA